MEIYLILQILPKSKFEKSSPIQHMFRLYTFSIYKKRKVSMPNEWFQSVHENAQQKEISKKHKLKLQTEKAFSHV